MKKTCPLMTIASSALRNHTATNCIEHKCAWWDEVSETCAVVSVVHAVYAIAYPVDDEDYDEQVRPS